MSLVKFERIVSVSSEDPLYPAESLLKSNYNDKKWKCKLPGEKQISVVIQMDSAVTINSIDVGNFGSAFIEVFVGKSSDPDDFKVLIVASSLMTLQEAKLGENISNVRFFKEDSLAKPVALEKWDRIKLVCSQPYNKFIQYGLSFVVVHSKNTTSSHSAVSTLGKFNLKTKDESEDITVGSLFAKRKAEPAPELKGAAAIRAASTSGIITQKKPSLMALYAPSEEDEEKNSVNSGPSTETNISCSEINPSSPVLRKDNKKKQKPDKPRTPKAKVDPRFNGSPAQVSNPSLTNGESSSKKLPNKNKEETNKNIVPKKCPEKPFNQLMGGVVFAISGFQNPYRSDLRNKALAMGAKYRPDWDNTCTHLLCAFPNTPKFNQVLGLGKIVTKEWIETCYSRRMRLPWRRFALHPPDKNQPESEEEIVEYVPRPPSPVDNRRRVSPGPASSGEDTEEEIERVLKLQSKNKNEESQADKVSMKDENDVRNHKHFKESPKMFNDVDVPPVGAVVKESNSAHLSPRNKNKVFHKNKHKESSKTSPGSKKNNVSTKILPSNKQHGSEDIHPMDQEEGIPDGYDPGPSRKFCETDIYEMDTDVEPENSFSKQYGLMPLLTYYEDIRFLIGQDLTAEERKKVDRYIFAHKGIVVEKPNSAVEFIITRSVEELNKVKNLCPRAVGVKPDWVWICHDCNYLSPFSKFEIK